MGKTAILAFAAIALAAFSACSPRERPAGGPGDGANETAAEALAADPETPPEAEALGFPLALGCLGRFAGAFEFYRYEIVRIHNMENPLDAREMAGDRIVVEPGADGRLRFSRIDARMADPDWLIFSDAGDPGWDPHFARRLLSAGFAFYAGDDSDGSMEILIDSGHVNGLAGSFGIRLWYEDEDTIVYEELRWRGLLWDDDAEPIDYRQITFRLVYRRIPAEPFPLAPPREGTFPAVPTTVAVRVGDRRFSAPAWEVDGRHYFDIRDIAYMLNRTRAMFSVNDEGPGRSRMPPWWRWPEDGIGTWLGPGDFYNPTGSEMDGAGRVIQDATVGRGTGPVIGGVRMGAVTARPLGTHAGLAFADIGGRNYFCLLGFGAMSGERVSQNAATGAITIETRVPTISERGLAAAREFLGQDQFRGLFETIMVWRLHEGCWRAFDIVTDEMLSLDRVYTNYRLFDLNGDGIPEIILTVFNINEQGVRVQELFAYSDGEYRRIASFRETHWMSLLGGDQGRIFVILLESNGDQQLYSLSLENGATRVRRITNNWWPHDGFAGETRDITHEEFRAMVDAGDWEDARDDFPDLVAFLDGLDTLFRIVPLNLDVFAESP